MMILVWGKGKEKPQRVSLYAGEFNFSDVEEDARPGGTIGDAHFGIM